VRYDRPYPEPNWSQLELLANEKGKAPLPIRICHWFDDEGTTALRGYFGETVFSFPLGKTIEGWIWE